MSEALAKKEQLLRALARLEHDADFRTLMAHLDTSRSVAMTLAATSSEMETIFRNQGAYAALNELIELVGRASDLLRKIEQRPGGTVPASRF